MIQFSQHECIDEKIIRFIPDMILNWEQQKLWISFELKSRDNFEIFNINNIENQEMMNLQHH